MRKNWITATVVNPGPKAQFQLTFRGDTISLDDSTSLNRWAAIGIVERHKLTLSQAGVSIDGHEILYSDPDATEHLERVLNRPQAPAHPIRHPSGTSGQAIDRAAPDSVAVYAAALADKLRVTREGFEFHVIFPTRFGETKTEKLDPALEVLQNMRVFKPHVSMQKSGIRLVVTCWDGENFVEQPGIENVEHASPEEIEELIRANLKGGPELGATMEHRSARAHCPVARVEVVKKSHDVRFHLVIHRRDGRVEDGLVLIRANMAKLTAEGVFPPSIELAMTAMNDRITVTRKDPVEGKVVLHSQTLPLVTGEDAKRLEELLNEDLKSAGEPEAELAQPQRPLAPAPAVPPVELAPRLPATVQQAKPDSVAPVQPLTGPLPERDQASEAVMPAPVSDTHPQDWFKAALTNTESIAPAEVHQAVFDILSARFQRPATPNEHDFPAFTIDLPGKDSHVLPLELVLAPHYLLCTTPFGYLRFGLETRLFLTRLDDYLAFPHDALRGVIERQGKGGLGFVVSVQFNDFLRRHSDPSYRVQFADFLIGVDQVTAEDRLLWPLSDEDRLFDLVARTARSYGLPVTSDAIVLDPNAAEFIGFKRVLPHGIEFRDGEDFVRFTPTTVELSEGGANLHVTASSVLQGWALDNQGHVCALYRESSSFNPPPDPKLLRFIHHTPRSEEPLTVLGLISPTTANERE